MSDLTPAQPPHDAAETEAWNRAHDRLVEYLATFALRDHVHVSQMALTILNEARDLHRADPARDPVETTMRHTEKLLARWMQENLQVTGQTPSRVIATGYVALLLSRFYRVAPGAFLEPLPLDVRDSLRRTLVITGPGLNISSMTPRHLDYGPMLDFARQTWHRFDAKTFFIALGFWACVYGVLYILLSGVLG